MILRINNYFHDSFLDEVIIDKQRVTVSLRIDFCFLARDGYLNDDPETGIVILEFKGVKNYPEIDGKLDSYSFYGQWFNKMARGK